MDSRPSKENFKHFEEIENLGYNYATFERDEVAGQIANVTFVGKNGLILDVDWTGEACLSYMSDIGNAMMRVEVNFHFPHTNFAYLEEQILKRR